MQNYISKGNSILLTAVAVAVVPGAMVKQGELVGVAHGSAPVGGDVTVSLTGVYDVPKTGVAITQGAKVYFDSATGLVSLDNTKTLAGYAFSTAAIGDASVLVKLLN